MKRIVGFLISITLLSGITATAVSTSAKAAAVINGDTGELYTRKTPINAPMASTTKIMTALLLCEHGKLQKEITVTADMLRVEGSSMGLLRGRQGDVPRSALRYDVSIRQRRGKRYCNSARRHCRKIYRNDEQPRKGVRS